MTAPLTGPGYHSPEGALPQVRAGAAGERSFAQRVAEAGRQDRQRRWLVPVVVLAVLLLVIGSLTAIRLTVWPGYRAQSAVTAYFDALARVDGASESLRTIPLLVAPEAIPVDYDPFIHLLRTDYYAPEQVTVVAVSVAERSAEVTVTYHVNRESDLQHATLRLRQEGGGWSTMTSRWVIENPLRTVHFPAPLTAYVVVNGLPAGAEARTGPQTVELPPGSHQVALHDQLLGNHSTRALVGLDGEETATPLPDPPG